MSEYKVGLVVNPIAGMGGKVGLKGTDGPRIVEKARELGAEPVAPERAVKALGRLRDTDLDLEILTFSDEMGEDEAKEVGFDPRVVQEIDSGETTPEDTKEAAAKFLEEEVDIILFAGGDGTARDLLELVDMDVPLLGIPTGVKMHSAAFVNTPEIAGRLVERYLRGNLPLREAEIMDVDEEAFRENELETDLKGFGQTPYDPRLVQAAKSPTVTSGSEKEDQKAIARWVVEQVEEDRLYILAPGTTTRAVEEEMGISEFTLLGVDLVRNGELLAKDVTERRILDEIEDDSATIIVSPIGKQGFILGRGNQQVSPKVVRKVGIDNIMILATPGKIAETSMLKVDTGDPDLDEEFQGYARVIMGYKITRPVPVA
ncbi:hypothetical protein AKJ63_00275 [candidate division MSBL1 archaeon SCGC-AAA259D18]|uniref:ATP-NAD kinase n=1 Tax=candidate division MSBL1 archaeon SCGC-AAA259D18 TaxID=1698262 RepID=A0A133UCL4_9EURY|nr:hypothetical protein AKJ63_00275 [candidate division MSBL1 archaeon SCGC-AAA259D18]